MESTDYRVKQPCELLEFLMTQVPGTSRTKAKQLLAKKVVVVGGQPVSQFNYALKAGDVVTILKRGNLVELHNKFVRIVYEDRDLLVIDKAEGILSNAPIDGKENSVKRVLDEYLRRESKNMTAHTVHRLDRYTSGLMIFAKRRDIQQIFIDHWRSIVADRRYVAVVEGVMEQDEGKVASWLKDTRTFMTYSSPTDNGGKYAVTFFRTLERTEGRSLVEFKLDTGRKNQIRVHMQDLHHSIVGDLKYGAASDPIGRVCLHAYKLDFYHPVTRQLLHFETPVPAPFLSLMK